MHRFAGVVLVDPRGWLLLQERDEHPVIDPECWGTVGGHVEDGEEYEAAAYREFAEETGVVAAPGSLRPIGEFRVFHEAYDSLDTMRAYAAATRLADDDVECHEGRRIVFVDPATVGDLPLTGSAAQVLPALLASELYADLIKELTP